MKKIEPFRTGLIATSTDLLIQGMIQKLNETISFTNEIVDSLEKMRDELEKMDKTIEKLQEISKK